VRRLLPFLFLLAAASVSTYGQIAWLADASGATVPSQAVSGSVEGKAFTAKFGNLQKSGGIGFGDSAFDHYTIYLQDAENGYLSSVFIELTVTVPKGALPDGKTFRRIRSASLEDQPGPGRKDLGVLALAEFYSLTIRYRKSPGGSIAWVSSGADRNFTGRLELDKRKADKLNTRFYVCFDDPAKSCAAGTAEISVR
jgi:hypothetical protein